MTITKRYRTGAVGALLDEYERAINELKQLIAPVTDEKLTALLDTVSPDEDSRSIQAILTHVVYAGYGYATSIHNQKRHGAVRPPKVARNNVNDYIHDLTAVFEFTEMVLTEYKDNELEQPDNALKIKTGWGQLYDAEQLMEHAIVHILRHRRQLELKMKD